MSDFKVLRGERINGMFLGNDNWALVFRTVDGKYFRFDTQNDCCNSVWYNHINGATILGEGNSFDLLRGAVVTEVEDKGWGDNRSDEQGHEVVQDGFWTIKTDRGYIDIEVRNSHNGYYGGSVKHIEDCDLEHIEDLKQVTEDF
jgi:hypothetical protein